MTLPDWILEIEKAFNQHGTDEGIKEWRHELITSEDVERLVDSLKIALECLDKIKWRFTPPEINQWSKNPDNDVFKKTRELAEESLVKIRGEK